MHILILGSGLLGVTSAYELARRGHRVTVIDRAPMSAAETSFANGGQLSYSHAEPWASPAVLGKLPKWLFNPDAPLVFRPRADWQMIRWGLRFLRNCTTERAERNCMNILRLGLYSKKQMAALRAQEPELAFDFLSKGILHLYGTQADLDHAKRQIEFQAQHGGSETVLSRAETLDMEPILAHTSRTIVGGIHAHADESGDAHKFCVELARIATEKYGVNFLYNVNITGLRTEGGRIVAVNTDVGEKTADHYIMAMGSYSSVHLRAIGIDVPIYPMKGYSITIPAGEFTPNLSITDGTYKIVYSRLGDRLRVAGTAEFAGYNPAINERRITPIVRAARGLLPKADWSEVEKWACLRPSTPDGPPILGRTPYSNLTLNTGHGTLGWTQATGSASIVADIIEDIKPAIALDGLTLESRHS
jgi:D-amino-acid dehydrogenase